MDHPVLLKKFNYVDKTAVVTDDNYGYGAILGTEWFDDNWEEFTTGVDLEPDYEKLHHMVPQKKYGGNMKDLQEILDSQPKKLKSEKDINDFLNKYEDSINMNELVKELEKEVQQVHAITEKHIEECNIGNSIIINGCNERVSCLLFKSYYTMFYTRSLVSRMVGEASEVPDGVEIYYDGEFKARIYANTAVNFTYNVHISTEQKTNVLKLYYDKNLTMMNTAINKLIANGIEEVATLSAVILAYNVTVFSLDQLMINACTMKDCGDLDDEDYNYIIITDNSVYRFTLDYEKVHIEEIDLSDAAEDNNEIVIFNKADSERFRLMNES
jgi:hypothetical protein